MATGLAFPEGPVADADGSILVTEIGAGTVARVDPATGAVERIADCGGGPNGAAFGPDGRLYVCNNGGTAFTVDDEIAVPQGALPDADGGSIQVVDTTTGAVEVLYTECGGRPLRGPNDIVFDADGGFYFTDHGRAHARHREHGGVYYARPDGSAVDEVLFPLGDPNGIGLSPDGGTLYVSITSTGTVWQWDVVGPGELRTSPGPLLPCGGTLLGSPAGHRPLDSLAVDAAGNVCVATLAAGVVTVITPPGDVHSVVAVPDADPFVSNLCFGGPDLGLAYVTSSGRGRLYETDLLPEPGAPLHCSPTETTDEVGHHRTHHEHEVQR